MKYFVARIHVDACSIVDIDPPSLVDVLFRGFHGLVRVSHVALCHLHLIFRVATKVKEFLAVIFKSYLVNIFRLIILESLFVYLFLPRDRRVARRNLLSRLVFRLAAEGFRRIRDEVDEVYASKKGLALAPPEIGFRIYLGTIHDAMLVSEISQRGHPIQPHEILRRFASVDDFVHAVFSFLEKSLELRVLQWHLFLLVHLWLHRNLAE